MEMRRRLRVVYLSRGGVFGERIAHLADHPKCRACLEEVAA